ncbi:hypothetical protein BT69DRAFT_1257960 [Atractiella rhizophila]|nr:hypothetical protein BT69DRAFT_1257960 [Atractiella rhizophila]
MDDPDGEAEGEGMTGSMLGWVKRIVSGGSTVSAGSTSTITHGREAGTNSYLSSVTATGSGSGSATPAISTIGANSVAGREEASEAAERLKGLLAARERGSDGSLASMNRPPPPNPSHLKNPHLALYPTHSFASTLSPTTAHRSGVQTPAISSIGIPGFSLRRTETIDSDDDRRSIRSSNTLAGAMQSSMVHAFRRFGGGAANEEYKKYWMADDTTDTCEACKQHFHTFRRKHHCRVCGLIFCSQCAYQFIPGPPLGLPEAAVRVCNDCWRKTSHARIRGRISAPINNAHNNTLTSNTFSPVSRSPSPSSTYSDSEFEEESGDDDEDLDPKRAPFRRKRLKSTIAPPIDKVVERMDFFGPRTRHKKRMSRSRARIDEEEEGADGDGDAEGKGADVERLQSGRKSRTEALATTTTRKVSVNEDRSDTPIGAFTGMAKVPRSLRSPVYETRDRKDSSANYTAIPAGEELTMHAFDYLRLMIRQHLNRLEVPGVQQWEGEMIRLLIKVAKYIKLDARRGDPMDIRNFVKIKRIPGGRTQDSEYVDGYICSKNLLHKQMERTVQFPKIVLCDLGNASREEPEEEKAKKGGFEYLNDVRRQEDIRVRALNSLGDRGADVLLFSFRVPRQVLEHLSKKGVSVAHDVKYRTMEAVERITRASIVTVPELEAYIVKMDEWETKETKEKEKKEREKEDTKRSGLFSLLKSKEKEESPAPPPITFGECTTFRLHTYVHTFIPERRKTIMRFEGCPKDLGCSLLLRGGTLENLGKVKRTLDMMVQLVYSLKLECHLLKEEGAGPVWPLRFDRGVSENAETTFSKEKRNIAFETLERDRHGFERARLSRRIQDSLRPYTEVYLSGSPSVRFQPPYPLAIMERLDREVNLLRRRWAEKEAELAKRRAQMADDDDEKEKLPTEIEVDPEKALEKMEQQYDGKMAQKEKDKMEDKKYQTLDSVSGIGTLIAQRLSISDRFFGSQNPSPSTEPVDAGTRQAKFDEKFNQVLVKSEDLFLLAQLQEMEVRHTERLRAWENYLILNQDKFTPEDHQNICLLQSTVSVETKQPCRGPLLEQISFYNLHDFTVGQVIESRFNDFNQICTAQKCGKPNHKHYHTWVHGDVKLMMEYERKLPKELEDKFQQMGEDIQMASTCKRCNSGPRWSYVSQETWRYSFGKFLQTCFYPDNLVTNGVEGCQHNPVLDYERRFVKEKKCCLVFTAEKVQLADIVVPPLQVRTSPSRQLQLRNEEYKSLYSHNAAFWDSVLTRIHTFSHESVAAELREASRAALSDIERAVALDRAEIIKLADDVYRRCTGNGMELNSVWKILHVKASDFNQRFEEFRHQFFPSILSHKEFSKLTSQQFRRLYPSVADRSARSIFGSFGTEASGNTPSGLLSPASDFSGSESPSPMPFSLNQLTELDEKIDKELHSQVRRGSESSVQSDSAASEEVSVDTAHSTLKTGSVPPIIETEEDNGNESDSTARGVDHPSSSAAEGFPLSDDSDSPESTRAKILRTNAVAALVRKFDPLSDGPGSPPISGIPRPSRNLKMSDSESEARRPRLPHSRTGSKLPRPKINESNEMISEGEDTPRRIGSPSNKSRFTSRPLNPPDVVAQSPSLPSARHTNTKTRSSRFGKPHTPSSQLFGSFTKDRSRRRTNGDDRASDAEPLPLKGTTRQNKPSTSKDGLKASEKKYKGPFSFGGNVSSMARKWEQYGRAHQARFDNRQKARPLVNPTVSVHNFANARAAVNDSDDEETKPPNAEPDDGSEGDNEDDNESPSNSRDKLSEPSGVDPEPFPPAPSPPLLTSEPPPITPTETQSSSLPSPAISQTEEPPSPVSYHRPSTDYGPSPALSPLVHKSSYFSDTESNAGGSERGSILKTLTSFFPYRHPDFAPINWPLSNTEHVFKDNQVIVREDEPSSIAAFALSSEKYSHNLAQHRRSDNNIKLGKGKSEVFMPDDGDEANSSRASTWEYVEAEASAAVNDLEARLCSPRDCTFQLDFVTDDFSDERTKEKTKFLAICFFADQFEALRQVCKCNDNFVESLSRCSKWNTTGGKSGSAFFKTMDDRFIIKELSKAEMKSFADFAPRYFQYMARAHFREKIPTLLAKIFGVYKIHLRNPATNRTIKLNILVMENLHFDRTITKKFDLKGSVRNRHVQLSSDKGNHVLLDENLIEIAHKDPLFVREFSKRHGGCRLAIVSSCPERTRNMT